MSDANPRQYWAPWTEQEVGEINDYQKGPLHPFTCAYRDNHPWEDEYGDFGVLRATRDGMVCAHCKYVQRWVYDWMANGAWRDVVKQFNDTLAEMTDDTPP